MKKEYVKPQIMFESFAVSINIAAGCEVIVPAPSSGTCGYAWEGGGGSKLFTMNVADCDMKVDDDPTNGFCYHTPIESNSLFNS